MLYNKSMTNTATTAHLATIVTVETHPVHGPLFTGSCACGWTTPEVPGGLSEKDALGWATNHNFEFGAV